MKIDTSDRILLFGFFYFEEALILLELIDEKTKEITKYKKTKAYKTDSIQTELFIGLFKCIVPELKYVLKRIDNDKISLYINSFERFIDHPNNHNTKNNGIDGQFNKTLFGLMCIEYYSDNKKVVNCSLKTELLLSEYYKKVAKETVRNTKLLFNNLINYIEKGTIEDIKDKKATIINNFERLRNERK